MSQLPRWPTVLLLAIANFWVSVPKSFSQEFTDVTGIMMNRHGVGGEITFAYIIARSFSLGLALGKPSFEDPTWYSEIEVAAFAGSRQVLPMGVTIGMGPRFVKDKKVGEQVTASIAVLALMPYARRLLLADEAPQWEYGLMIKIPITPILRRIVQQRTKEKYQKINANQVKGQCPKVAEKKLYSPTAQTNFGLSVHQFVEHFENDHRRIGLEINIRDGVLNSPKFKRLRSKSKEFEKIHAYLQIRTKRVPKGCGNLRAKDGSAYLPITLDIQEKKNNIEASGQALYLEMNQYLLAQKAPCIDGVPWSWHFPPGANTLACALNNKQSERIDTIPAWSVELRFEAVDDATEGPLFDRVHQFEFKERAIDFEPIFSK